MYESLYGKCTLCKRECKINRNKEEYGVCKMGNKPVIARADLHFWEEPIISGSRGSGTVFFSGCSLLCVYCQNEKISRGKVGRELSCEELAEVLCRLQRKGAHNVNFVTPTHFVPSVLDAVSIAKKKGFSLPIVYNTSGYDSVEALKMLEGVVDVYLTDFKYFRTKSAAELSHAPDYTEAAKAALSEMVRQKPLPVIDSEGIMRSGVIVRILLLPHHVAEAKLILKYVFETYGDSVYISLMNQYTPMENQKPPLDRRVTHAEYEDLVSYAIKLGVKNAFTQDYGTAKESFIPDFDCETKTTSSAGGSKKL